MLNIDEMTPDELRRRLRDALNENESLRRRLENNTSIVTDGSGRWTSTLDMAWKVTSTPKDSP